jgi:hypothetical protein
MATSEGRDVAPKKIDEPLKANDPWLCLTFLSRQSAIDKIDLEKCIGLLNLVPVAVRPVGKPRSVVVELLIKSAIEWTYESATDEGKRMEVLAAGDLMGIIVGRSPEEVTQITTRQGRSKPDSLRRRSARVNLAAKRLGKVWRWVYDNETVLLGVLDHAIHDFVSDEQRVRDYFEPRKPSQSRLDQTRGHRRTSDRWLAPRPRTSLPRVFQSQMPDYGRLMLQTIGVMNLFDRPTDPPTPGSMAAGEFNEARIQPAAGDHWGEEPVRMALAVALMNYQAALEQARAAAALMTGEFTIIPTAAILRSIVDAASQAWWLLEPDIGLVARVRRMQAIRFRNASQGEWVARKLKIPLEEFRHYTETTEQVAEFSRRLSLEEPSRRKDAYMCGDQELPRPMSRASAIFADVEALTVFDLYLSFMQGELFSLWQAFEPGPALEGRLEHHLVIDEDAFLAAVAVISRALQAPATRGIRLFGLDDRRFNDWIADHDSVFRP